MGTVNYRTSDYITLGIEPVSAYDLEQDADFMREIRAEVEEYGGSIDEAIRAYIRDGEEADRENAQAEIDRHNLHYYHIKIEPGYYEGFSLDIESNFPIAFNDWQEKRDTQKEITEIKHLLHTLADYGLREVFPGWTTGYSDYTTTHKSIDRAIRAMREEAKATPTWKQYEREEAI